MTELNRIPVLDHGYVRLVSASPTEKVLDTIKRRAYRGATTPAMIAMPSVTLEIRLPYAVLISLTSQAIRFTPYLDMDVNLVLEPNEADIGSPSLEVSREIAASMKSTVNALVTNQHSYVADGCDRSIATITTPIAAYWEGVATAQLDTWIQVINTKGSPRLVQAYQIAIANAISTEFKSLDEFTKRVR